MTNIIQTKNLTRVYHLGGEDIYAVNDVSLEIPQSKMTAIVGRSGSGKTTLLNLIAGLDDPTSGEIWFDDERLDAMSEKEKRLLRLHKIGFVFQSFGLLPLLNASENVGVPLRMRYLDQSQREEQVRQALEWVGLSERAHHRPNELSGGEQQRVAIARALASHPRIVMADEPTGQLDSQTGASIIGLLRRLVNEQGITALIITHDPKVMQAADLVYHLSDGQLVETLENTF